MRSDGSCSGLAIPFGPRDEPPPRRVAVAPVRDLVQALGTPIPAVEKRHTRGTPRFCSGTHPVLGPRLLGRQPVPRKLFELRQGVRQALRPVVGRRPAPPRAAGPQFPSRRRFRGAHQAARTWAVSQRSTACAMACKRRAIGTGEVHDFASSASHPATWVRSSFATVRSRTPRGDGFTRGRGGVEVEGGRHQGLQRHALWRSHALQTGLAQPAASSSPARTLAARPRPPRRRDRGLPTASCSTTAVIPRSPSFHGRQRTEGGLRHFCLCLPRASAHGARGPAKPLARSARRPAWPRPPPRPAVRQVRPAWFRLQAQARVPRAPPLPALRQIRLAWFLAQARSRAPRAALPLPADRRVRPAWLLAQAQLRASLAPRPAAQRIQSVRHLRPVGPHVGRRQQLAAMEEVRLALQSPSRRASPPAPCSARPACRRAAPLQQEFCRAQSLPRPPVEAPPARWRGARPRRSAVRKDLPARPALWPVALDRRRPGRAAGASPRLRPMHRRAGFPPTR